MSIISRFNSTAFLENLKIFAILHHDKIISVKPGPFLATFHELEWLKSFLNTNTASALLSEETKIKLETILEDIPELEKEAYIQTKQMPHPKNSDAPFFPLLKKCIRNHQGFTITFTTKAGHTFTEEGFPFEFVYNIARKRWYIKWINSKKMVMITPLDQIKQVNASDIDVTEYRALADQIKREKPEPKKARIQWTPQYPNMDIHRFLHAFSAFRINMLDRDTMEIDYLEEEEHFLLSKIRQFGPHVFIQSPPSLQQAMLETAKRALENYN